MRFQPTLPHQGAVRCDFSLPYHIKEQYDAISSYAYPTVGDALSLPPPNQTPLHCWRHCSLPLAMLLAFPQPDTTPLLASLLFTVGVADLRLPQPSITVGDTNLHLSQPDSTVSV